MPNRLSITILQSSDELFAPMLNLTGDCNFDYAAGNGYTYRRLVGNLSHIPNTANFNRYYLLRQEIELGEHDWALWMDADAIVVDHNVRLESFVEQSPDKLIIACRGGFLGDYDINNGVFLLNLRHHLARELVDECILRCELLDPLNTQYCCDQYMMHEWLQRQQDSNGRNPAVTCYKGDEANLLNYDGPFIRHVMREFGSFDERMDELRRLSGLARRLPRPDRPQPDGDVPAIPWDSSLGVNDPGVDATSFQRERGILVCTCDPDSQLLNVRMLLETCEAFDIELTILARVGRTSVESVAEYLLGHPRYRYVLFVSADALICASLREMLDKFLSFDRDIVVSASRRNMHDELVGTSSNTTFRHIDGGCVFATSDAWLRASYAMADWKGARFVSNASFWNGFCLRTGAEMALDSECRLFQVCDDVNTQIGVGNPDLSFEGRRVVNRETGGRPCLIRRVSSVPWGQYITSPSTVWIWPLIDRLREFPVGALLEFEPLRQLLLRLGLDKRVTGSVHESLLPYTSAGLCIERRPDEFAEFLTWLVRRPRIQSYVEFSVGTGGAFMTTTEYLRRFRPLDVAIAVDSAPSAALVDYADRTPGIHVFLGTSPSAISKSLKDRMHRSGLVVIDGNQPIDRIRDQWEFASSHSRYVALTRIAAVSDSGVTRLWSVLRMHHQNSREFLDLRRHGEEGIGVVDLNPHLDHAGG